MLTVEAADLIFATDSIPAIFAVTQNAFIVFTSNLCAVLGLRSLYFLLAGALRYFRFLKTGMAFVLIFIGAKMLIRPWCDVSTLVTLAVVAGVIASPSCFPRPSPRPPPPALPSISPGVAATKHFRRSQKLDPPPEPVPADFVAASRQSAAVFPLIPTPGGHKSDTD